MKGSKKRKVKWIVVLIILGVFVLTFLVLLLAFRLKNIHVTGNEICSEEEVIDNYTSGPLGNNMLMVAAKDRFNKFDEMPFVRDYEITYNSRNDITIHIYEKSLVACFYYMGSYIFFDKDGTILEASKEKKDKIPCIEGVKFNSFTMNKKIDLDNEDQIEMILNIAELINHYEMDVDKIYFDNRSEVTLYCGKIQVILGKNKLFDQQIASVSDVLKTAKKKKLKGIIDMKNYVKGDKIILKQQK